MEEPPDAPVLPAFCWAGAGEVTGGCAARLFVGGGTGVCPEPDMVPVLVERVLYCQSTAPGDDLCTLGTFPLDCAVAM